MTIWNEPAGDRIGRRGGGERNPQRGSRYGSQYDQQERQRWTTDDLGYDDRGSGLGSSGYGVGSQDAYYDDRERGYARQGSFLHDDERTNRERDFMERASDEVASWLGDEAAAARRRADRFRGKGPRGYIRSDRRILEDVSDRLSDDGRLDASDIEPAIANREVTLNGFVRTKMEKRRAEDCAYLVSGVTYVQNNLRVRSGDPIDHDIGA